MQSYPDAFFAVRVNDAAPVALQTHPLTPGVKGVTQLTYSGSYPVSKLSTSSLHPSLESADLFAFSSYKVDDMEASARPMAAFSLAVATGSASSTAMSFMMNLPTAIEPDMVRRGTAIGQAINADSAAACLRACNKNPAWFVLVCVFGFGFSPRTRANKTLRELQILLVSFTHMCGPVRLNAAVTRNSMSWNYARASNACTLQKDAPNMFYELGNDCGLRSVRGNSWCISNGGRCDSIVVNMHALTYL